MPIIKIIKFLFCILIFSLNDSSSAYSTKTKTLQIGPELREAAKKFQEATCSGTTRCGWYLINNHTLGFRGEIIVSKTYKEFSQFYESNKIDTLVINTIGGAVIDGMEIGEVIRRDKLNISVDGYCISSCANYFFLLASGKTIKGIVGFHGGVISNKWQVRPWWERINPIRYIANYYVEQKESSLFSDIKNLQEFINQTGSGPKGNREWSIFNKLELEDLTRSKINGDIDHTYVCFLQRYFDHTQSHQKISDLSQKKFSPCAAKNSQ